MRTGGGCGACARLKLASPATATIIATTTNVRAWGPVIFFNITDSFSCNCGRQRVPIALAHAGAEIETCLGDREAATIRLAIAVSTPIGMPSFNRAGQLPSGLVRHSAAR